MKTFKDFVSELNEKHNRLIHSHTHKYTASGKYKIHSGKSKRTGGHIVIVKKEGEK